MRKFYDIIYGLIFHWDNLFAQDNETLAICSLGYAGISVKLNVENNRQHNHQALAKWFTTWWIVVKTLFSKNNISPRVPSLHYNSFKFSEVQSRVPWFRSCISRCVFCSATKNFWAVGRIARHLHCQLRPPTRRFRYTIYAAFVFPFIDTCLLSLYYYRKLRFFSSFRLEIILFLL